MVQIKSAALDLDLVDNGRWCTDEFGMKWKVASFGSPPVQALLREMQITYQDELIAADIISLTAGHMTEATTPHLARLAAEAIVKETENVEDEDGSPLKTPARILAILSDRRYQTILSFILNNAREQESFREKHREATSKN